MAKLGINTGTTPNDGTGDSLLSGANKINSNFDEVYSAIGDGTNISIPVTSIIAGDNISVSGATGDVTVTGTATTSNVSSNTLVVTGVSTLGVVTGATYYGDGSNLSGVIASGVGVTIQDSGSDRGTATILNFGSNLSVTNVNSGILTVTASGGVADTSNVSSDTLVVTGVSTLGIVTGGTSVSATHFYGDGSALTGIGTFSRDYNDLTNTPTIPTNNNQLTNGAGFITASDDITGNAQTASIAGIATYTSEWTLGANGTSDYTFTGPGLTGTENDPTLYLTRGQQYKFYNNSGGHPFRIQSTPNGSTGTQYNDGIPTNDVGTGSTLTWDVQFDAPNKLYYQCTSHPDMGGPIYIVPRTEPAVGVRTEVSGITAVAIGATNNLNITGFKSYGLLKVGINSAAWVRLYVDEASRTSDADRSYLTDPSPGSGLIAEVRTETAGASTFLITPGVIGYNNDVSVGTTIYSAVTNNESTISTIKVDLTVVKMED